MRSRFSGARAALMGVLTAVACVSCDDVPFCVPWVDPKQQYQVELLDRAPPDDLVWVGPSCGSARFLMDTGDVLPMRILSSGATTCREAGPVLTIPDVQIVEGPHPAVGTGDRFTQISTRMMIMLNRGCLAELTVAIASAPASATVTQSDYILHRTVGGDVAACVSADIVVPDGGSCTDGWFVKIADGTGRVVTKHPEGGI